MRAPLRPPVVLALALALAALAGCGGDGRAPRTLALDGRVTPLTTGEFALVRVFAQHPRQALAREKLMQLARGRDHEVFDRAIDVQVSRLRKLVEPDPGNPRYLQTVRGVGYVYVPDDGAQERGA